MLPLRNQTLIPRYPSLQLYANIIPSKADRSNAWIVYCQVNHAIHKFAIAYSFEGDPCRRTAGKHSHSLPSSSDSWISSGITTSIQVKLHVCKIDSWIIELFAVASYRKLYTHMHGLTFETSIWLLAGSTRFLLTLFLWSCKDAEFCTHVNIACSCTHTY